MTAVQEASGLDRPTRPLGRVVVAAVGVFVLLRLLLPAGDGLDVVALPAEDSVEAAQLSDGTPVWIVRGSGEDIGVIQALAPETVSGVGELVAWCPAGDRFVAGHHGRSFAPDGRRYTGACPSGLPTDHDVPPADLVTHTWTILEGSSDAGDPLRVGPAEPVNHPTELLRPTLRGPLDGLGPPAGCRMDPVVDVPVPSGPAPLDHTAFLAPLQTTRDGWQIVEGNVLVQPDGRAIWCQGTTASGPPGCRPDLSVDVDLGVDQRDTRGVSTVLDGPMAVRLDGGRVVQIAVLFGTRWRGGPLRA